MRDPGALFKRNRPRLNRRALPRPNLQPTNFLNLKNIQAMQNKILFRAVSGTAITLLVYLFPGAALRAQEAMTTQGIQVTGAPVSTPHPTDDTRPKLEHIMREVDGTQITVTKKATVI